MRRWILVPVAGLLATAGLTVPHATASAGAPDWGTLVANRATLTADQLAAVPGARRLPDGTVALALRRQPPSWLTPDLVAAAARGPVAAPAAATADVPASGFVGIRPGSFEVFPYGCTMDFVLQQNSQLFIATAGHCVDKVGDHVTLVTLAPVGSNPVLVDIGAVVVQNYSPNRLAPDYAIVAINPALYPWVFPTIAQVGGPCGAYTGNGLVHVPVPQVFQGQESTAGLEQVAHYGHGLVVGTGGTARTGVSLYWDAGTYWWDSPSTPGDSGSPVRVSNLQAAGNLTDLVVYTDHPGALIEGTRISSILGGYSLVNSPYCP